jgi:hypothetical protein
MTCSERDVVGHGPAGQQPKVLKTVPIWRRIAGSSGGELAELAPGDEDLALCRSLLAQDQSQERRLARSGGTDQKTNSPFSMSTLTSASAARRCPS